MQVTVYVWRELKVSNGTYQGDENGGWIDFLTHEGTVTLHCMTPNKIRDLAQQLTEVAQQMEERQRVY